MDDIILARNSLAEFDHIKELFHNSFHIKALSQLRYFFVLEGAHSQLGITICQSKYCLDLLVDFSLIGCKPTNTPLDPAALLY